jgi:primosomal replication protein N
MNRLVLSAQLVQRSALRFTPAGVPACDFELRHESQVSEAGIPRKVSVDTKAVALGEVAQRVAALALGGPGVYAGFLASGRNGRGIVFHVTAIE